MNHAYNQNYSLKIWTVYDQNLGYSEGLHGARFFVKRSVYAIWLIFLSKIKTDLTNAFEEVSRYTGRQEDRCTEDLMPFMI